METQLYHKNLQLLKIGYKGHVIPYFKNKFSLLKVLNNMAFGRRRRRQRTTVNTITARWNASS